MRFSSSSLLLGLAALLPVGCSSSTSTPDGPIAQVDGAAGTDAGGGGPDAGLALRPLTPPTDPGAKGVLFTASGEGFAKTGYSFPPDNLDDVHFVDGWEIRYDRILTTFDHVTLNENPDTDPGDESKMGALVAEVDGPWVADLHVGGTFDGKEGGPGEAAAFAALTGKNKAGGGAFDPTVRYAFSFDVVPANPTAININLTAADLPEYQLMVDKGYTTLLVGTATWKGTTATCVTTGAYDFTKIPTTIKFHLGFAAPTSYINAQNPENTGAAFTGEESQRGIQVNASTSLITQATFHIDHVFWESFVHDSPAHFDTFAAHYVGATGAPTVQMEDFIGASVKPIKDKNGVAIPWRWCAPEPAGSQTGNLTLDTQGIQVVPGGDPTVFIRDFYDYTVYNHSTSGHLNADGLSFVKRHYPSP